MPRSVGTNIENNFGGGLITEATGLNFPENACTDTSNCIFTVIGQVQRRFGFDFENAFSTTTINRTSKVIVGYLWRNVAGDGNVYLYVLQVGGTLFFYTVGNNGSNISNGLLGSTITLSTFSPGGAPIPDANECQFSAGNGYLFVTHPNLEPFAVFFNTGSSTFTTTQINIMIRDFDGTAEAVTTNNRPAALTAAHNYDLLNQGWTDGTHGDNTNSNLVNVWITALPGKYPSNADVWWLFKNSSGVFDPAAMSPSVNLGNTPAPNGHFILKAFNQDRNTASGLATLPSLTAGTTRPSTVAFFAGRVFYAGTNVFGFNNSIYFSQIVDLNATPTAQFGNCYQSNDPTSEDAFDLLPSDGGVIKIADCGTIHKLFAIQGALVVFCSNGIWTITGSTGLGFRADDYSINKLSSIHCISPSSFVDVLGFPMWWCNEGIYTLRVDVTAGGLRIDSLTDTTVKTYYQSIPSSSKAQARGYYNPLKFTVQWLFNSQAQNAIEKIYSFDSVLNFNTLTGSFAPWTSSNTNVAVNGITVLDTFGGATVTNNVIDASANNVINAAGDSVVQFIAVQGQGSINSTFKYLVSYPNAGSYKVTFADNVSTLYKDWFGFDSIGVDYTSSFTSGFKVHGQGQHRWQANYVYVYMDNTTPNAYTIQGVWDFSNTGSSGKETSIQQFIGDGAKFTNSHKRWKIRGEGLALQLRFKSISGLPFTLFGWSIFETSNSGV